MKKFILLPALLAGALLLTSCGTTGSSLIGNVGQALISGATSNSGNNSSSADNSSTSFDNSVLGSLLGNLIGESTTITEKKLAGTWNYTGADCAFESENFLAKAGGAVAAGKINEQLNTQLAKVGIKQGACSFTFKEDNTYSAVIGGRNISGNYTIDAENKKIKMTYLGGLGSMSPHVSLKGNKLSLLLDSDKLLNLVKTISALSNSSSIKTVSSLLGNYDGMYIGIQLKK